MTKRRAHPALGIFGALLLAACAPAQSAQAPSDGTTTDWPGVSRASPRVGQATAGTTPFPAPPAGYRGLGGAFMNGGALVVVAPDMSAPMQKHDLDVGLLHGMAAGHPAAVEVRTADCRGSGEAPGAAIVVPNLADPADEVAAGIACARLRHPGARWLMSQLVTRGDGYLSQVALGDGSGNVIVVYTDVNRFAAKLIDELGG
ncbi:MAG TPA: hypothetical protein VHA35_03660 [Dongiaceae bacterium]|nr:hypothetical protein [Dongiaceae bacterium]